MPEMSVHAPKMSVLTSTILKMVDEGQGLYSHSMSFS